VISHKFENKKRNIRPCIGRSRFGLRIDEHLWNDELVGIWCGWCDVGTYRYCILKWEDTEISLCACLGKSLDFAQPGRDPTGFVIRTVAERNLSADWSGSFVDRKAQSRRYSPGIAVNVNVN